MQLMFLERVNFTLMGMVIDWVILMILLDQMVVKGRSLLNRWSVIIKGIAPAPAVATKSAAASATKGSGFPTEMGSVYGTSTETGRDAVCYGTGSAPVQVEIQSHHL